MQWGEPAKPHNEPLNLSGAVLAHYEDDDDDDDDGVISINADIYD